MTLLRHLIDLWARFAFLLHNRKCTICDGIGSYNVINKTGWVIHVKCNTCAGSGIRPRWE